MVVHKSLPRELRRSPEWLIASGPPIGGAGCSIRFELKIFGFMKWKVDSDRTVVGDRYRVVIVQIGESARKMRRESVRTFRIARILEAGLDGDPVAPEFSNSHLSPHELGCEARN